MTDNSDKNPFHDLLGEQNTSQNSRRNSNINTYDETINSLVENVFLITVRKKIPKGKQFIFMEEIHALVAPNEYVTLDNMDQALFERLLLSSPQDFLIPNNENTQETDDVIEKNVIIYLFKSFTRNMYYKNDNNSIMSKACENIEELIFRNITTASKQPELFEDQNLTKQWLDIFQNEEYDYEMKKKFLILAAKYIVDDDNDASLGTLKSVFYPVFNEIKKRLQTAILTNYEKWIIPFFRCFAQDKTNPKLAELLLEYTTPNPDDDGRSFNETVFGLLLALSILPKIPSTNFDYYEVEAETLSTNYTSSLWGYLTTLHDSLHLLFKDFLLVGGVVREKLLNWIGACLFVNAPRGEFVLNSHNII